MRTETIEVYKFEELSEEVQKKVIEKNQDVEVDNDYWHDNTIENWKEKLEELGFYEPVINYSGFWSQGDGASFTCSAFEVDKMMELFDKDKDKPLYKRLLELYKEGKLEFNTKILRTNSHYYHERSTTAYLEWSLEENIEDDRAVLTANLDSLENDIEKYVEDLNRQIYKSLEEDYNELTTDEVVKEYIIDNEWEFTKDGERWQR